MSIIQDNFDETLLKKRIQEYCINGKYENTEGINYILYFMFENCDTIKTLEYYQKYSDKIIVEDHHIKASILYLKLGDLINAKKSIVNFVKIWKPIEWFQIMPMRLWQFDELKPLLILENCLDIFLNLPNTT